MLVDIEDIFRYKTPDREKLVRCGFVQNGTKLKKRIPTMLDGFDLVVTVSAGGEVDYRVMDNSLGEEYVLARASGAEGGFVGEVRDACEKILTDIANECFETGILKAEQTKRIIALIRDEYGAEPEFLWEKYPDCAAFRRKDNAKWFAAIMMIDRSKIGLEGSGRIEIIDLKADPDTVEALLSRDGYYPAYHMNKKHWFTVCLDGSLADDVLFDHIADSFRCVAKR